MRERRSTERRRGMAIAGAFWLLGAACAGEHAGGSFLAAALVPRAGGVCGSAYLADVADDFRLDADTSTPGASPPVVFEMFIPGSSPTNRILLTRRIVITLPAAFGFAGFGVPGTSVGAWDFDFSNPGNGVFDPFGNPSDYRIPHRATGTHTAYADTLLNGTPDAGIDSTVTHALGNGGTHVFTIEMPSGGTNNNGFGGNCSYFDTDVRFTLPAGIVTLPVSAGEYDVSIVATSVDPDTGDDDDGQGTAPTVYQRTVPVAVPEATSMFATAAAVLALARLRRRAR